MDRSMLVYIGIGSNLGDRKQLVTTAVAHIDELPNTSVTKTSNWYETEPVGIPGDANPFINGVVEVGTELSPRELLNHLLSIEKEMGRERADTKGYQSRLIDLDILIYGDKVIDETGLTIPHPHLEERAFVLVPLNELCGDKPIPGSYQTVHEALQRLRDTSGVQKISQ